MSRRISSRRWIDPQDFQDLRRRAMGKLTQAWMEELRKKAYIDIKLR